MRGHLLILTLMGCAGTISSPEPINSSCLPPDCSSNSEVGGTDGGTLTFDAGVPVVVVPAPVGLVATVTGNNRVGLRWSMPDASAGTETFSVNRLNVTTGEEVRVAERLSENTFSDISVTKNSEYAYTVVAQQGPSESVPSEPSVIRLTNASMLFHTKFGRGVVLQPPTNITASQAWQEFTGLDADTGFSLPIERLGSYSMALQLIGPSQKGGTALSPSNVSEFFDNRIQSMPGPSGPVNALFFSVQKKEEPVGDALTQVPIMISRPSTIGDVGELYISYWFKFPSNLADLLDETVPAGFWRVMFEWKTGGYNNTYKGDYRMKTQVFKTASGELRWQNAWDNVANLSTTDLPGWQSRTYWSELNPTVRVPVGEWFKFEVYWHRSSGPDGRYWAAVNGQTIVDHVGSNMGDFGLPINRIMLSNAYSGGRGPVEGYITDVQIWDGFPCGNGVSCP